MGSLPRAAQLYVLTVVLAGAVLAGTALGAVHVERPLLLLIFCAASTLAAVFKLRLPLSKNESTMSISYAVDFTALLVIGAGQTVLVSALAGWSQGFFGRGTRNPLHRTLFNMAALTITVQAAGLVYEVAGGTSGRMELPADVYALLAATTTYFLFNTGLVAGVVALATSDRAYSIWSQNFFWSAPSYYVGAGIAVAAALLIQHEVYWAIALTSAPLYLTYRSYTLYAGRIVREQQHAAEVSALHERTLGALDAVQRSEHRMRDVIESISEGMFVVDRDGLFSLWNGAAERLAGRSRSDVLGCSMAEAVPEWAGTRVERAVRAALDGARHIALTGVHIERDGHPRVFDLRLFAFPGGVSGFFVDVTEQHQAQEALRRSEERYALAARAANDGLWDWDLETGSVYYSPRWRAMLGLDGQEGDGIEQWFARVHPDDLGGLQAALEAHGRGGSDHVEHEYRARHADGTYRWLLCRGVAVRNERGVATRIAGSQSEITDRRRVQEQLQYAAAHDALTGLANRSLFMEALERAVAKGVRAAHYQFAVLFVDLDRFKVINDSLGHLAGDELLLGISRRLTTCVRTQDVIARFGGDEFAILLDDVANDEDAAVVAERIRDSLAQPLRIGDHDIFAGASIGIALSSTGYRHPEEPLRDADTAMYRAKALGGGRHELFDATMHARAVSRLLLENDLRRALDRGEFRLHYQPIVGIADGRICGFEALLRWRRPDGAEVRPGDFIALAEETGVIVQIGQWVLREVCAQLAVWQRTFSSDPPLSVAVNVSARQLVQPDFVESIAALLEEFHLAPGTLHLELTESALMEHTDSAIEVLTRLKALDVELYLDDFGTGYSSLSYLHRYPIDTLKIDRTFIGRIDDTLESPLVATIIALARQLRMKVIAEGVETPKQLLELKRLGCDKAQGFALGQPRLALDAAALLAEQRALDFGTVASGGAALFSRL
jgi:diguanylate cyclase (GGDEF)-like protein/PAS domain S-box-containing protein